MESQHAAVEGERALQVGHFQMHMADGIRLFAEAQTTAILHQQAEFPLVLS